MRHYPRIAVAFVAATLAAVPSVAAAKDQLSSAEHREDLTATVTFSPLVLTSTPETFSLASISGDIYLTPDLALNGQAFVSSSGGGRYDMDFASVGLKLFVGNSLYLIGGVAHRDVQEDLYYSQGGGDEDDDSYSGPNVKLHNSSVGAFVALGNQWQWRRFTLGGQWLGGYLPTATTSSSYDPDDGETPTAAQAAGYRAQAKAWGSRGTVLFSQLFIGFSW